jgi:hypothetical protein
MVFLNTLEIKVSVVAPNTSTTCTGATSSKFGNCDDVSSSRNNEGHRKSR